LEKNNKKNGLPGDPDNLRLKDHLNASFDIDNIKVSEDLIARTLKAIGESGSQEELLKESNNVKHFPVRRLVSAAAVILVLLVGINVLQNGLAGNKNATQIKLDKRTTGESAAEQQTMDILSAADNSSTSLNGSKSSNAVLDGAAADSVTADNAAADKENAASDGSIAPFSTEVTKDVNSAEGGEYSSVLGETLFSGLYPITFDSVETFTVSKNDGTQISLTNAGDKVSELYALLDGYSLTATDTKTDGNENNWIYKIEIKTSDKQIYTIIFSDNIQVLQSTEVSDGTPFTYNVGDLDKLIKQVDEFYVSLK